MNTGQINIGEGCRGVVTTPPGGRMIAASDQDKSQPSFGARTSYQQTVGEKMNELALFAGAGGGLLGGKLLGWRTVCYVEREPFCIEVLKARIKDGFLDDAPIWDNIKTFNGRPWTGKVDILTAGFPCQPFSLAGKKLAQRDERNLWPETLRVIEEVRPAWCLLENVPGLLGGSHGYFGQILRDLAERGFIARWECVSAAAIGAPHSRNRLWILAYAGRQQCDETGQAEHPNAAGGRRGQVPQADGDAVRLRLPRADAWFAYAACMARVSDGVADRMDRTKAIGNGQVPAVVRAAWKILASQPGTYQEIVEIKRTWKWPRQTDE